LCGGYLRVAAYPLLCDCATVSGFLDVIVKQFANAGALASITPARRATLLFRAAAETLIAIAANPKHLGARVGFTAVLHSWGSALTHHPHVHMIVHGGGLSPDGSRWIACKPRFFLPVRALSRLFRRLFLEGLAALHEAGRLASLGDLAPSA
jgi:putative transposase